MAKTFLQLVQEVLRRVDETNIPTTLTGGAGLTIRAMEYVNETVSDIYLSNTDWSFRETIVTIPLVVGQTSYALTQDIDLTKPVMTDQGSLLLYVDYEDWFRDFYGYVQLSPTLPPNLLTIPAKYTIYQNKLWLYPFPANSGTISYVAQAAYSPLALDGDIPVIPEKLQYVIIKGAVAKLKMYLGDQDWQLADAAYQKMLKTAIQHNRRYSDRTGQMHPEPTMAVEYF